jgi:hypothetical protein
MDTYVQEELVDDCWPPQAELREREIGRGIVARAHISEGPVSIARRPKDDTSLLCRNTRMDSQNMMRIGKEMDAIDWPQRLLARPLQRPMRNSPSTIPMPSTCVRRQERP